MSGLQPNYGCCAPFHFESRRIQKGGNMTHKYKKPGHVIVHSPEEPNQAEQNQESLGNQIVNQARSTMGSVQEHIANHYAIWTGVGLVCAAAVYLVATEHGSGIRNEIQDTLTT